MQSRYILLTAAKDEEACIAEVLQLVVRQTFKPLAWFIMDDGSSDRTAAIISSFAAKCPFIRLQSIKPREGSREGRNFASKDKAIMAAYDFAKPMEFSFVGVQDADQAPEREDYYELILRELRKIPSWEWRVASFTSGIAGCGSRVGAILKTLLPEARRCLDGAPLTTSGAIHLFGHGGEDTLAQYEVERAGWGILTQPDLHIYHYRRTSSAGGILRGMFRAGLEAGSLGYHPIFEMARCFRRVPHHPFVLGSLVRLCGYLWWKMCRRKPLVKAETATFIRRRQMRKLRRWALPRDRQAVDPLPEDS